MVPTISVIDVLNLTTISCPMSLLKVKQAVRQLKVGQQMTVQFRDQASLFDTIRFIESSASLNIIEHNKLELRLTRINE